MLNPKLINRTFKMDIFDIIANSQQQAHCDINTGKIYGCDTKSLKWWHEKGHIEFSKLQATSVLQMWQGIVFLFWMFSVTLALINKFMLWIALPMLAFYIGIDVYEEYWCNRYAKLNYRGDKNRSKNEVHKNKSIKNGKRNNRIKSKE